MENFHRSQPPPEPPMGQQGLWDLHYCNLYGWTWVRKSDKNVTRRDSESRTRVPSPRLRERRKRHKFCCFLRRKPRRYEQKTPSEPMVVMPPTHRYQASPRSSKVGVKSEVSFVRNQPRDDDCGCGYCNDNNLNECCPCVMMYCTCCGDHKQTEKCTCRNACTQTHTELKETSAGTSQMLMQMQAPKGKPNGQCRCRGKKVLCIKAVCCCGQNACCPCVQNPNQNKNNIDKQSQTQHDQDARSPRKQNLLKSSGSHRKESCNKCDNDNINRIVNLCLTNNLCKSNLSSILNPKSEFPTLHKSLDLLLKNNANIMSLINENKELKKEYKSPNFLDLNHSISCLSIDNNIKKSDDEHSKLLTAVCDAILSSQKFENDGCNSHGNASSSSMDRASQNSINLLRTTGNVERILNDLNFSTQNARNTDQCNLRKEIGVQVNNNPSKKSDRLISNNGLVGKLSKSRNRTLNVPRICKKPELLKNVELIKMNFKSGPVATENHVETQKNDDKTTLKVSHCENASHRLFLPLNFTPQNSSMAVENKGNASTQPQNLEQMLASMSFNFGNNLQIPASSSSVHNDVNTSLIQNRQNVHLLEDTSPPFTDYDLPFLSENKRETNSDN